MRSDQYKLGALKSPGDFRDHIAETVMTRQNSSKPPAKLDLRSRLSSVRNQGSQGSCAAQSGAAIREWQENKEFGYKGYLSPQFVYNLRANSGEGMHGRNVMSILLKQGICRESTYSYGIIENAESVPESVKAEAENHVIKEYARIITVKGVKQSLYKNGPCYISFPVYNYGKHFWKRTDNTVLGGHAVALVGYNAEGFIIRNSWGSSWNTDGHTVYPYEDWGSHWEIWTVLDADTPDHIKYNNLTSCCTCCIV